MIQTCFLFVEIILNPGWRKQALPKKLCFWKITVLFFWNTKTNMKTPELECLFNKVIDLRSAAHRCFVMFCHAFQTQWISWNLNLENDTVRNVASLVLKKVRINKKWNSWENSCPKLFCKESVLKHSRENTCIRVSFLMKLIKFFYWKETTLQSLTPLPPPPSPPIIPS